ncbi:MAG: hypothetical protein BZ138_00945 [Methanosphaera sp. rholeuAM270]|nr:MAG: hypothetical protein BZ138_00945 [Methanosphaera sp. rholeuAM270]
MNSEEKEIIKALNKLGVDTRFISLSDDGIYINNLKFSKFSRRKEEKFRSEYPQIKVIRSKLFQKICIKVSRTIKNQIKPKQTLYIEDDSSLESKLLYILLEPYRRKYGISITHNKQDNGTMVKKDCLTDFTIHYINLMINAQQITDKREKNTICPLAQVPREWILDWAETDNVNYTKHGGDEKTISTDILEFLEEHIPNVQESIRQSVYYLDKNKQ